MDEAVIRFYRRLLKTGFRYAGSIENPSVFLTYDNSRGVLCGNTGDNLRLFVDIDEGVIKEIKYLCICDPTTNVVIEAMCMLVEGKSVIDAKNLTEDAFSQMVGAKGEEFLRKSKLVVEFLREGIIKFEKQEIL